MSILTRHMIAIMPQIRDWLTVRPKNKFQLQNPNFKNKRGYSCLLTCTAISIFAMARQSLGISWYRVGGIKIIT